MGNGCLRRVACALSVAVLCGVGSGAAQASGPDEPEEVWIFLKKKIEAGVVDGPFTFEGIRNVKTNPIVTLTTVKGESPESKDKEAFGALQGTTAEFEETGSADTPLTRVVCREKLTDRQGETVPSRLTGDRTFSVDVHHVRRGITCTVTNGPVIPDPKDPPTLTVVKQINEGDDGLRNGTFIVNVEGRAEGKDISLTTVLPGYRSSPSARLTLADSRSVTITETQQPGFEFTSAFCEVDGDSTSRFDFTPSGGRFTVPAADLDTVPSGANITCTLVNTPRRIPTPTLPPTLTVIKQLSEDGDRRIVGDHTFRVDVSGIATKTDIPLLVSPEQPTSDASDPIPLNILLTGPNTLTISEARQDGFDLTSAFCKSDSSSDPIKFEGNEIATSSGSQSITLSTAQLGELDGNITCTLVNTPRPIPPPPPTVETYLTITKVAIGGNGTFSFVGENSTVFDKSVTTSGGRGTLDRILVNAGPLTITEERLPKGVTLVDIACAGGSPRNDLANRRVNLTVRSGENIVCIFTNRIITTTIIRNFLNRRAEHLTGDTGRPRLIERRRSFAAPSLKDSLGVYGAGSLKDGKAGYRTSLRRAFGGDRTAAKAARYGLDPDDYGVDTSGSRHRSGLDVWSEGRLSYFETDGANGTSGHFGVVRVGADYLLTPSVLIGFLAQFDRLSEDGNGYSISGHGFMVGPYVEYEVSKGLYFDAKALWGRSTNDVSPFDTYTDEFSTTRWLIAARLTGSWSYRVSHQSAWHFSPRAEVVYFSEKSESYTDSNNVQIDGQRVNLGRVKVGPEISYRYTTHDGTRIEPRVSAKGLWAFGSGTARSLDPAFASSVSERPVDDFQLQLGGGLVIEDPSGVRLDVEGSVTGLVGSDTHSAGGKVNVTIPLQEKN